jgi:hypothetical protein
MTEREQRLLELCRRLLRQNEDLQLHTDRLYAILRKLCLDYRSLGQQADRAERDHRAEQAATSVLLGAAMDQLAQRHDQGAR